MILFSSRWPLYLCALLHAGQVFACASCGSGGDDPLILYPNEVDKAYVGVARTTAFKNVDADGRYSTAGGPTTKDTLSLAYGHSFTPRAFMTGTLPLLRNSRQGASKSSLGDPSLAARYTAIVSSIADPWTPQLQLLVGYKQSLTHSIHDSADLRTGLDIFGSGFSEAKVGVDLWFAQNVVLAGGAISLVKPMARSFDGVRYEPGFASRATATAGYLYSAEWRTTFGVNREERAALKSDGAAQPDSAQLNYSAFMTQDWMLSPLADVRLSLSRRAAFGANQNTARSDTVNLAYMRSY